MLSHLSSHREVADLAGPSQPLVLLRVSAQSKPASLNLYLNNNSLTAQQRIMVATEETLSEHLCSSNLTNSSLNLSTPTKATKDTARTRELVNKV